MRILIVEDDLKISSYIQKGLEQSGYTVDQACDGDEGLASISTSHYDLLLVDLMLPKVDGLTLIETMRSHGNKTPILILSAKQSVDDRVKGLQKGGDDYLTKPFSFAELLARIQALLRRANQTSEATHLSVGDIKMDLLSRQVIRDGKPIELHQKEFALLEYFLRNPGHVLTKTLILDHVWNYQFDPQTNVVDVLVCRLRNKLDKDFKTKCIHTLRGVGYVFKEN
jgi:two-component system OmpR family response regulator